MKISTIIRSKRASSSARSPVSPHRLSSLQSGDVGEIFRWPCRPWDRRRQHSCHVSPRRQKTCVQPFDHSSRTDARLTRLNFLVCSKLVQRSQTVGTAVRDPEPAPLQPRGDRETDMAVIIDHENATHCGLPRRFRHALGTRRHRTTNGKRLRDGTIRACYATFLLCESARYSQFRRKSTDLSAPRVYMTASATTVRSGRKIFGPASGTPCGDRCETVRPSSTA
jgi:hypothetical protein